MGDERDVRREVEHGAGDEARFDAALASWAARPPATAADEAARQLARRLEEPAAARRPSRWPLARWPLGRWVAVAAAAALVAALGLLLRSPTPSPTLDAPPVPTVAAAELEIPPLGPDVVLLWIDAETPLYLSLPPTGRTAPPPVRRPKGDAT